MQGFRRSAEFQRFLGHVRSFVGDIAEMRHYDLAAGLVWRRPEVE